MELGDEAATVAATDATTETRIEIVAERRRMHDAAFRGRMVELSMAPGARVQELARQHGIVPSLLYRWRRLASGEVSNPAPAVRLLPVQLAGSAGANPCASKPAGLIEIELADGVRVRVDDAVSVATLRRVLGVLRG